MEKTPPIVLIDGFAMIYRCFHAISSNFTTPEGQPTNALYGMARFFLSLQHFVQPTHCSLVLDKGRCQKRTAIHSEYKAQRPPMPVELRSQLPLIKEWATALGWPVLEKEGVEADDIIAGLSLTHGQDHDISIISFDKDLTQLVNHRVTLLQPTIKNTWRKIGIQEVMNRYSLKPFQICDYLCLLGDSSDNIPGVSGIGERSAEKLLNQYQTIQGIYDHFSELTPSMQSKLKDQQALLAKNHDLIVLDYQLPEELASLDRLRKQEEQGEKLNQLCLKYGFRSLLKNYPAPIPPLPSLEESTQPIAQEKTSEAPTQFSLF